MMDKSEAVTHLSQQQCFIIEMQGEQARLEYRLTGNEINFHHTFVPPALRGKGLAEYLVRHGLAWATAQNLKIHASCSYVQKFLKA
jgi:uncharacterized protein